MSDQDNICYMCFNQIPILALKTDSVRPCVNQLCTARIHKKCLEQQFEAGTTKCGVCQADIHITKKEKLNATGCVLYLLKQAYIMSMILFVGPAILSLLALGKTTGNWKSCENSYHPFTNNTECDTDAIYLFPIVQFWLMCWAGVSCGCGCAPYFKRASCTNVTVVLIISCGIIVLAHCIGYFAQIYVFGINANDFFTWRTSESGFIMGILLSVIIMLIMGAEYIRKYYVNKFTEREVSLGMIV